MQRRVRLITRQYPRARVTATRSDRGVQRWQVVYLQAPGQEIQPDAALYWPTAARASERARRHGLAEIARITDRHEYEIPTMVCAELVQTDTREASE